MLVEAPQLPYLEVEKSQPNKSPKHDPTTQGHFHLFGYASYANPYLHFTRKALDSSIKLIRLAILCCTTCCYGSMVHT